MATNTFPSLYPPLPLSVPLPTTPCVRPSTHHTLCPSLYPPHPVSVPLPTTPCVRPSTHHTLCPSLYPPHPVSVPLPTTPCVRPSTHHTLCPSLYPPHPVSVPLPNTPWVRPSTAPAPVTVNRVSVLMCSNHTARSAKSGQLARGSTIAVTVGVSSPAACSQKIGLGPAIPTTDTVAKA